MLITISPAKKLAEQGPLPTARFSQPDHLDHAAELIDVMREKDSFEIADLMKLSMKLADLNLGRFQAWSPPFSPENARPALYMFAGDVFQGMDTGTLSTADLDFAQEHLRILSGLYGLLRPLDLIQAYRLEMGTRLQTPRGRNLYDFWGDIITDAVNTALTAQGDDILINLASNEYFSSIDPRKIKGRIITPVFKEYRKGALRVISFNAKRARGMMCRHIIDNRIDDPEELKSFARDDYRYAPELSTSDELVFTR